MNMAICSGDCHDNGCKLIDECERVYQGSHPPCSDIAESAPSASTNSDYAAALRAFNEFHGSTGRGIMPNDFTRWCEQRLNSAKAPNCA
jgi:hypothetical protein